MTHHPITQRLAMLRDQLRREHLAAYIFPTGDPHQSEYTADRWKSREWISGFDGSAGTAVVTLHSAALWTDSRYFLAAEEQLEGTGFLLMRERIAGTPTIAQWLRSQLLDSTDGSAPHTADGTEVGIDGMVASASAVAALQQELRHEGGLTLRTNFDPLQHIWRDRPAMPCRPVVIQPLQYAGEPTSSKLCRIRRALRAMHADGMLMSRLDDIAWTLNLRGADVHCNPVFISHLLIDTQRATLYINKVQLSADVLAYLHSLQIAVDQYENVADGLLRYREYNILIDADEVSHALREVVRRKPQRGLPATLIVDAASPVPAMKAVKSEAEQQGFRSAMLRDGVAMVKFLCWLDGADKTALTEISVCERLEQLRAAQPLYRGLSFDTIAGFEAHGAIVHYEATPATDAPLAPRGLLLLDSGAQYQDGTTDITRTIALGPVSAEQQRVYTLVLRGHIRLQMLQFPAGASGSQLDAIAREPLWHAGYNFLHGTGHGVGSFLCVHEGPHQIRMEWRPAPLLAGMTVTDEPGIYLAGRFGVRIENTLLVVEGDTTECGHFLRFETLTLCPIDKRPILVDMLSDDELQWLNHYHQTVYDRLSPHVDGNERQWLRQATLPLQR